MSHIPHLLSPYIVLPPEGSLVLLTSVLGASTNWLVLRFLQNLLVPSYGSFGVPNDDIGGSNKTEDESNIKVLLVSFMRDLALWKDGARKLGLDLNKMVAMKKFVFIDGLSELYLRPPKSKTGTHGTITLRSDELKGVHSTLKNTLRELQASSGKVVLVIDQLDLLLAASGDKLNAVTIGDALMDWRLSAHSTILTLAADAQFTTAQDTQLEAEHAAFLLSIAHQTDVLMGLRLLDTGTARDISGVCRITTGDLEGRKSTEQKLEARELLYFVGGDGAVKVFERGQ